MTNPFRYPVVLTVVGVLCTMVFADHAKSNNQKVSRLRLLNTTIFGKTTADPVVLLKPTHPDQLDPSTVMVDIEKGKYFAATVRYPKKVSFDDARGSLNTIYAKHEKEAFADDPTMGLWRNEDEKFAIQLTEEEDDLVVIYIKFSLVTKEKVNESLSRAIRQVESEENEP